MDKTIIVMCALDVHLGRIQRLFPQMKKLWGNEISFGIGNFAARNIETSYKSTLTPGKRWPNPSSEIPVELKKFAESNGIHFYAAPRQEFIPTEREQHCCEVLGLLAISKHFYDIGFESVYLIHTDIRIENDFLPFLDSLKKGDWSFIVSEILEDRTPGAPDKILRMEGRDDYAYWRKQMKAAVGIRAKSKQPSRASLECLIFNKAFVHKMYERYETIEKMWYDLFYSFPMWGDIGLYNICEDFFGFNAIFTKPFLVHGVNRDE